MIFIVSLIFIIIILLVLLTFFLIRNRESYQSNSAANSGFIQTDSNLVIRNKSDQPIYSLKDFHFLSKDCPSNLVNKFLNNHSKNLNASGLFSVISDNIYQVRSYDLANITLIRTLSGFIIADALTCKETCAKALELAEKYLGILNIHTVILTHSHIDHFGGIGAIIEYCSNKNIKKPFIIGPKDFFLQSTQENILAHHLLSYRSDFMYGNFIKRSCDGMVGAGLGLSVAAGGTFDILPIDLEISNLEAKSITIDNLVLEIWYTPDAEAPTELMFYIPSLKTLCSSEIIVHSLHNLYSPRGTKTRNGFLWASYIDYVIQKYGKNIQCIFASHHWPMWGNADINTFLRNQRDIYRFIHDQTIRYSDRGCGPITTSNLIVPPKDLIEPYYNKSFYGSFKMNVRSQYSLYFGPFDGNPAHLDPLPELEECSLFVEFGGGPQECFKKANRAIASKNYRWAITILNKLVMSHPQNTNFKNTLASVYKTVAASLENPIWRNFYLTGAMELQGDKIETITDNISLKTIVNYKLETLFQFMSIQINPSLAKYSRTTFFMLFPESNDSIYVEFSHGVLFTRTNYAPSECVDCEISTSRIALFAVSNKPDIYPVLKKLHLIKISGDKDKADAFFQSLDPFNGQIRLTMPVSSSPTSYTNLNSDMITKDKESLLPFVKYISLSRC